MESKTKNILPSLSDLHHEISIEFKNDKFNTLLNQNVPESWIKIHPFQSNIKYLPIEKIEFLLTRIFQNWRAEIISYSALFNSVAVHVRLHLQNPLTGEWTYHDGVGAVGVQTDKGSSASDLSAIKQDAIMKALPAAESYAIKDAAEKLGILFGKNLNRKDTIGFTGAYSKFFIPTDEDWANLKVLFDLKEESLLKDEKNNIQIIIKNKEENSFTKVHNKLKSI